MGKWLIIPDQIVDGIIEAYCNGIHKFKLSGFKSTLEAYLADDFEDIVKGVLSEHDVKVFKKTKIPTVRTLGKALNIPPNEDDKGIITTNSNLLNILCYFGFKRDFNQTLAFLNIDKSQLGNRYTGEDLVTSRLVHQVSQARDDSSKSERKIQEKGSRNTRIEESDDEIYISGWTPDTKDYSHRQGLSNISLYLKKNSFKRLTCTVYSNSRYYRFGVKIGGEPYDEKTIETPDDSILIHTGVGSMYKLDRNDLFTAIFKGDDRAIQDGIFREDHFTNIMPRKDEGYVCEVYIDKNNVLYFSINNQVFEKNLVSKESQKRVHLFSWADRIEYELKVKNIRIETIQD